MLGYAQLLNVRWPIFVTNLSFVVPLIFITCKKIDYPFVEEKKKQEKQIQIYTRKTNEKNVENKEKKPIIHKKKNAKQKRTIQEDQDQERKGKKNKKKKR